MRRPRAAWCGALAALAGLAWTPVAVAAQIPGIGFEVEPYAGGFLTSDLELQELKDAPVFGARLGVRLPVGFGVEGQLAWSSLDAERVGVDEEAFDVGVLLTEAGLLWRFPLPGPVEPFLGIGAGRARFDPDLRVDGRELDEESSWVASAGGGVRVAFGGWGVRADLREHLVLDALDDASEALGGDETLSLLEASLGLSFVFF